MASDPEEDQVTCPTCPSCAARETELARLREKVARLEKEKAALLKAAADRDYERPPHYL